MFFGVGTVNLQLCKHSRILHQEFDQSDQGFALSIIGLEWKICQEPSEMINSIVSGNSPILVEFT